MAKRTTINIYIMNPVAMSLLSKERKVRPSVIRSRKGYTRKGRKGEVE